MKRYIALIALGFGTASFAQMAPAPAASPVAKTAVTHKVVVHKKVHARTHTRTVTRRPSATGVAHTNVVKQHTVATPAGTRTRTMTKSTTTTPAQ